MRWSISTSNQLWGIARPLPSMYTSTGMSGQTVAGTSNTLSLTKGKSFAFVSGLGGHSVRPQSVGGSWWASAYASTCLAGDAVCQPNASPGALFGVFNVDGQPNKALFYFKDINGRVVDSFVVYSNVEAPQVGAVTPAAVDAGRSSEPPSPAAAENPQSGPGAAMAVARGAERGRAPNPAKTC